MTRNIWFSPRGWMLGSFLLALALSSQANERVRLQLRWLHQFQFAGYYMALEKGYYRNAGLDVELLEGGPQTPSPITSLLSGKVDFIISNSGLAIERMQGKPVVALAAVMQTSPIVWIVRADSDIYAPQDLVGKRLMMMPPPESAELLITLREQGVDLSKLNIVPTSYHLQDLIDRKADAYDGYISNEPFSLQQQGISYRLINPTQYGVNFYSDVLATRQQLASDEPQMVANYTRASLKGWQYALDHIDESVALIHQKYAPGKSPEHLRQEALALKKLIMPELVQLGHMNPERWSQIAHDYIELGMVPGVKAGTQILPHMDGFLFEPVAKTDSGLEYLVALLLMLLLMLAVAAWRILTQQRVQMQQQAQNLTAVQQELQASNAKLDQLASTDRLTGLCNRIKFEELAAIEIRRAQRYHQPLALIFFDIDHFKQLNEQHGHGMGDQVLVRIAQDLKSLLREFDIVARWGGEEFLVLAPNSTLEAAIGLAEKLRQHIAEMDFGAAGPVTASFGVTLLRPEDSLQSLLQSADDALYDAKGQGRNQVRVFGLDNLQLLHYELPPLTTH